MNFTVSNDKHFQTNSSVCSISARNKHHCHRSDDSFSFSQKSTSCAGIRIFSSSPHSHVFRM